MEQRIIHKAVRFDDDLGQYVATGGISVIIPWLGSGLTIEEIAAKDVPTGAPYKIVDVADVPSDRQWRNEWTVDAADLDDGVGA